MQDNRYIQLNYGTPDSHKHDVLDYGLSPIETGWDSESIRVATQTSFHKMLGKQQTLFHDLRGTDKDPNRFYFMFGSGLW